MTKFPIINVVVPALKAAPTLVKVSLVPKNYINKNNNNNLPSAGTYFGI